MLWYIVGISIPNPEKVKICNHLSLMVKTLENHLWLCRLGLHSEDRRPQPHLPACSQILFIPGPEFDVMGERGKYPRPPGKHEG